jgi:His/Glu/Gln/Arg/opine family amino acid ABC transporter permease subunit
MTTTTTDTLGPPRTSLGVIGWLHKNLFSTWYNTILTIVALWFIYTVLSQLIVWALTAARWEVITANLRLFMVGPFPPEQVWRVWLVLCIVSTLMGLSAGAFGGTLRTFAVWLSAAYATLIVLDLLAEQARPFAAWSRQLAEGGAGQFWIAVPGVVWLLVNLALVALGWYVARGRTRWRARLILAWLVSFFVTVALLQGYGRDTWLPEIGTNLWGGLLLTFMLAVVSIVVSFPLGVLLALGRRSKLPAVKIFCILYIELVRGVPLVTILYMTQIMLPLFLPGQLRIDNVTRAIAGDDALHCRVYGRECARGVASHSDRTNRSGARGWLERCADHLVDRVAASAADGDPSDCRLVHQFVQGYDAGYHRRAARVAGRGTQCVGAIGIYGLADGSVPLHRRHLFRLLATRCRSPVIAWKRRWVWGRDER